MGYLIDFIGLVLAIIIVAAYTKKLKRKIIYNRYKQAHTLSSREFVFYHHLKKSYLKVIMY